MQQRCLEAKIQCGNAVVTCKVKSWEKELSHRHAGRPGWSKIFSCSTTFLMILGTKCAGVGFVRRPHLLVGGVHSVTTILVEVEGQQELREIEGK